jgi:hypothetical protein
VGGGGWSIGEENGGWGGVIEIYNWREYYCAVYISFCSPIGIDISYLQ